MPKITPEIVKIENYQVNFMKDFREISKLAISSISTDSICFKLYTNKRIGDLKKYSNLEQIYTLFNNLLTVIQRVGHDEDYTVLDDDGSLNMLKNKEIAGFPLYQDVYGKMREEDSTEDFSDKAIFDASFTRLYDEDYSLNLYTIIYRVSEDNKNEMLLLNELRTIKNR
ncbi:hypothetical protein [Aliarcobacter butzleri]|uniref:hypothetical protein n=1 Tax=Aliarcobacter butzleri TaxID=28197 RepID=UPI001269BB7E|nr:hypothetical protein [Aliarcobacter butzleri]